MARRRRKSRSRFLRNTPGRDRAMGGQGDGQTRRNGETGRGGETAAEPRGVVRSNRPVTPSPRLPVSPSAVRVHVVRENMTKEMSLEDYVLGVVAAEGSTEDQ